MQELIQKIMDFLQNFDPSKILPNIAKLMTDAVIILRICVLAGPILLAVLGAVYFFLAPKEANHSVGYRFFWGMTAWKPGSSCRSSPAWSGGLWESCCWSLC